MRYGFDPLSCGRLRRQQGDLHPAGPSGRRVEHRDGVEPQQHEVVEVVGAERLSPEVGVDEAQPAEAAEAAPQTPDVGEVEPGRISDDDVADGPVAADEDADLPADLGRNLDEVASQLG